MIKPWGIPLHLDCMVYWSAFVHPQENQKGNRIQTKKYCTSHALTLMKTYQQPERPFPVIEMKLLSVAPLLSQLGINGPSTDADDEFDAETWEPLPIDPNATKDTAKFIELLKTLNVGKLA